LVARNIPLPVIVQIYVGQLIETVERQGEPIRDAVLDLKGRGLTIAGKETAFER